MDRAMIPEGFEQHYKKSRFTDPWDPLYSKICEAQVQIGVELRDAHCNTRGMVHGGFLASLADLAIGASCGLVLHTQGREVGGLVTVSLAIDYLGQALVGEWICTDTEVVKTGRQLCVAQCLVRSETRAVARVNATFQITEGA